MKQVFDFSLEQFHAYLLQTMAAHKCYQFSSQMDDHQYFTIKCPSRGIVIDGNLVPGDGNTELYLSATSPFCVLSAEHEQRILADLLVQLDDSIHHPSSPSTPFAPRHSFRLKGFRFLKKVVSGHADWNRHYQ
jgi:hypothetical protein